MLQSETNFELNLSEFTNWNKKGAVFSNLKMFLKSDVRTTIWTIRTQISEHKLRMKNKIIEALMVQHFIEQELPPEDFQFIVLERISNDIRNSFTEDLTTV